MQTRIESQEDEINRLRKLLKEKDEQIEVLNSSLILEKSRLPE